MIAIATTTRADWGLLTPLVAELERRDIALSILASNMHLIPKLGMTVNEIEAGGYEPYKLATAGDSPDETYANTVIQYGKWFCEHRPEAVIILGDRYEMLAVASAAVMHGIRIIHIAGGTVSEGAIDNSIRNAISQLAGLHLAETPKCAERLRSMNIAPERIIVAGALGVRNALRIPLMTREEIEASLGKKLPSRYFVGTLHAATLDTTTPSLQMANFLDALGHYIESESDFGALLTYPNNDTNPTPLIAQLREFAAQYPEKVILVASLGMRRYLSAVALSEGVIGNSSSGVVEVASLGVPTLDIGIRQRGRERAPSVVHAGGSSSEILDGLKKITSLGVKQLAAKRQNPYYRDGTPEIMADSIAEFLIIS